VCLNSTVSSTVARAPIGIAFAIREIPTKIKSQ
jgi:hypothetical protein